MGELSNPAVSAKLSLKCRSLEAILHDTFLAISSLREALHFQENSGLHSAFSDDSDTYINTGASQKKVICRELKKLSELQHRFRWQGDGTLAERHTPTLINGTSSDSETSATVMHLNGGAHQSFASLKLELQKRDAEIRNLIATVERLVLKKEKLERRVRKLSERSKGSAGHGSGIATTHWDEFAEEDRASLPRITGDGVHFSADKHSNVLKKSAGRGEEVSTGCPTVACATGNGVFNRYEHRESTKNGPNAMSETQRCHSDGHAEAPLKRQGRSELRKVFDACIVETTETVSEFSRVLLLLMRKAKWDIEEGGVEWVMVSHKALAVQSYVCMQMFRGFENEDFYMSGRLSWLLDPAKHRDECRQQFEAMVQMVEEPLDLLAGMAPDSAFGQFCRKKFLQMIPASMEEALLGDLRHRHCLLQEAAHPRWSRFYQAFVRMSKAIWTVHKLAFSLENRLSIFQAEKGADFAAAMMVSHIPNVELASDTHNLLPKVAFTIMPGFRIGENVLFKCRVYLNGMKMSSPANSQG